MQDEIVSLELPPSENFDWAVRGAIWPQSTIANATGSPKSGICVGQLRIAIVSLPDNPHPTGRETSLGTELPLVGMWPSGQSREDFVRPGSPGQLSRRRVTEAESFR